MNFWRAMRRGALNLFRNSDWERAGLMLAVIFLSVLAGMMAANKKVFPYPQFQQAQAALFYLLGTLRNSDPYPVFLFQPAGESAGVVTKDEAAMQPGLTALTWYHDDILYLLDARGRTLHRYEPKFGRSDRRTFRRLFRKAHGQIDRLDRLHLDRARILPDGSALLLVYAAGRYWDHPLGLVKIDRHSNILWRNYEGDLHHDFDLMPGGRIVTLARTVRKKAKEGLEYVPAPYVDDLVVILSPDGEVLQRISLFDALQNSDYSFRSMSGKIMSLGHEDSRGDFLHTNNVDYITEEMARNFPHAEEGNLLISMRNLHAIGVLDIKERSFKWVARGPWVAQHDPDILPNGNILVFDNLGGRKSLGRSRILEVDPHTLGIVWRYEGTRRRPFESVIRGSQQRLPNGNTLITESALGRIFEVDRAGRIVWDLHAPFRRGEQDDLIPGARWAVRVDPDDFNADFRNFLNRQTPARLAGDDAGPPDRPDS